MRRKHASQEAELCELVRHGCQLAIRLGLSVNQVTGILRHEMAHAGVEALATTPGRKITFSELAILTGLPRQEVARLLDVDRRKMPADISPNNKIFRIVRGWFEDRDFQNALGRPRKLAMTGENSFGDVVRRYAGDVTPQSAAKMLTQSKLVNREQGKIWLTKLAFLQRTKMNSRRKKKNSDTYSLFRLLSDSFVSAPHAGVVFFERATLDNISDDVAPIIQARAIRTMRTSLDRVAVIKNDRRQRTADTLAVEKKSRLHAFVCVLREVEVQKGRLVRISKRHFLAEKSK